MQNHWLKCCSALNLPSKKLIKSQPPIKHLFTKKCSNLFAVMGWEVPQKYVLLHSKKQRQWPQTKKKK